jgi:hypothetical protein
MRAILCWGAHAPTRARDDALVIALFVIRHYDFLKVHFGGAPKSAREARALPRTLQ